MTKEEFELNPSAIFSLINATNEVIGQEEILLRNISDERIKVSQNFLSKVYDAPSGKIILMRTGKKIGSSISGKNGLKNYFKESKLGSIEILKLQEDEMTLRLHDTGEAHEEGSTSCPFSKGFFIGFFKNHIGHGDTYEDVTGKETKCKAEGEDYCEFRTKSTVSEFSSFYG